LFFFHHFASVPGSSIGLRQTMIYVPIMSSMMAVRLHGPGDLQVEQLTMPPTPQAGEALVRVTVTSICGSDLHSYKTARIGDTPVRSPLVLGHEFAGHVVEVGPGASDGNDNPLLSGTRVAVDPSQPCNRCEYCERGHPNLCRRLHFCGLWPDDGSLREYALVPARTCFPLPDTLTDVEGALLEPLGIALHAIDLARPRVEESVAILGAGPIGLLTLQLAKLCGARPVLITETLPWRSAYAACAGADLAVDAAARDPVEAVQEFTGGRGVDLVIEAAWGDETVSQAADMAALGGRIVLVGISESDQLSMRASSARRKGLTVKFSRRMKHTYPRCIRLAEERRVDLTGMITHRFKLHETPQAFALNADYRDEVIKVIIDSA
jgi:L-iditol 2-dehydrogenase